MSRSNYLAKVEVLVASGIVKAGITHVQIEHDSWCDCRHGRR